MSAMLRRYSPQLVDAALLDRTFVARHELVQAVADDVEATVEQGGARFELLVGPRGSGKSHVLQVLLARLHVRLEGKAQIVALGERTRVASALGLLSRVLAAMPELDNYPSTDEQIASLRDTPATAISRAVEMITARLQGRPLILAIEALDRVLVGLGKIGQARLRGILQTIGRWTIVGTARVLGDTFTGIDYPFFNTFIERRLPELTAQECRALLAELANVVADRRLCTALKSTGGFSRVQTVRHLAGGQPLVMVLLFPHLDGSSLDRVEPLMVDLCDDLTPLFDDRLDQLPPGQAAIVDEMARSWRPMTVSTIARNTYATHQTTSGQLRYLLRDGTVRALRIGRERFYELADPLHRLMAGVRHDDDRAMTFIAFLADWYRHDCPPDLKAFGAPQALCDAHAALPGDARPWASLAEPERRVVAMVANKAQTRALPR